MELIGATLIVYYFGTCRVFAGSIFRRKKDPDGLIIKKPDSASASPDLFTVRDITVDMDIGKTIANEEETAEQVAANGRK
ncbi:AAEL002990-PA [Aedes aegypti]|uniref:AAEL002990-PA n=1 Tax=Aedes aegypti TaxID=7159 RepID=Q17GG9_AEDAE|nr:AAEL002990-PA [Aedes aegypti]